MVLVVCLLICPQHNLKTMNVDSIKFFDKIICILEGDTTAVFSLVVCMPDKSSILGFLLELLGGRCRREYKRSKTIFTHADI